MTSNIATDLSALGTMIGQFAAGCYDHGVLATHSNSSLFETCDVLSILSDGSTMDVTGFDAFDEDVADADAILKIQAALSPRSGANVTILAGDACIVMGPGRPFVRALRPTADVLVIETGGPWPGRMIVVVDRVRGVLDAQRMAA